MWYYATYNRILVGSPATRKEAELSPGVFILLHHAKAVSLSVFAGSPPADSIYRHPWKYDAPAGFEHVVNGFLKISNADSTDISVNPPSIERCRSPPKHNTPADTGFGFGPGRHKPVTIFILHPDAGHDPLVYLPSKHVPVELHSPFQVPCVYLKMNNPIHTTTISLIFSWSHNPHSLILTVVIQPAS